MSNSYTGLFQTLAASFNKASLAKEGRNVLTTMVTRDFSPEVNIPFGTVNTNIAASTGTVTNLASGTSQTFQNVTVDPGAVLLNQHPTYGFALPSFDLARGPSASLVEKLRDEAIKKLGNYINGVVAALVNTTDFNTYAAITASGADTITDAKMGEAWKTLASADVPVGDLGNFFLCTAPVVYSNLVQAASWAQSAYVGDVKASEIRTTARLGMQWGAVVDFDPDIVGSGDVTAGTYDSLLFHRNAIALVARALAPPANPNTPCSYVYYKGIPIRVIIDFNQTTMSDQMTFDALFGAAVVRPDHGIVLTSS